jgi:MYXO-CTERM domain-containing protein
MLLQFRLTVADPSGQSDTSMTTVTVADGSSISTGNNSGGGAWDGLIGLLALCLLARRPAAFTVSRMDAA